MITGVEHFSFSCLLYLTIFFISWPILFLSFFFLLSYSPSEFSKLKAAGLAWREWGAAANLEKFVMHDEYLLELCCTACYLYLTILHCALKKLVK